MCLARRFSNEELKQVKPNKVFKAFKFVEKSGNDLISPCYHYVWKVGTHISDHNVSGEGFYVTYFKPGEMVADKVRIEVTVNPEDIVKAGPDQYGGYSGTCFVVKKLTISKKQWAEANGITMEKLAVKGRKIIKKAKKKKKKPVHPLMKKIIKKIRKKTKKK